MNFPDFKALTENLETMKKEMVRNNHLLEKILEAIKEQNSSNKESSTEEKKNSVLLG